MGHRDHKNVDTRNLPEGWAVVSNYFDRCPQPFTVRYNDIVVATGRDLSDMENISVKANKHEALIRSTLQEKARQDDIDRRVETIKWRAEIKAKEQKTTNDANNALDAAMKF